MAFVQRLVVQAVDILACDEGQRDRPMKLAKSAVVKLEPAVFDAYDHTARDFDQRKQHALVGGAMVQPNADLK